MIYYAECQMNGDLPPPKNIKEQWITYVILNSAGLKLYLVIRL